MSPSPPLYTRFEIALPAEFRVCLASRFASRRSANAVLDNDESDTDELLLALLYLAATRTEDRPGPGSTPRPVRHNPYTLTAFIFGVTIFAVGVATSGMWIWGQLEGVVR